MRRSPRRGQRHGRPNAPAAGAMNPPWRPCPPYTLLHELARMPGPHLSAHLQFCLSPSGNAQRRRRRRRRRFIFSSSSWTLVSSSQTPSPISSKRASGGGPAVRGKGSPLRSGESQSSAETVHQQQRTLVKHLIFIWILTKETKY